MFLTNQKIILDNFLNASYNNSMKNKNIYEMDLHEAISHLEKQHNCIIYGVLDMQSLEEDICDYDLGVRSLSKVSRQEWRDAMEYAYEKNQGDMMNTYITMTQEVAEYLRDTHVPNPLNTLGGYSG